MVSLFGIFLADVCLLLAVAFYTLLERKVLGYIHLRKGPNKVGIAGLPQPLADALKLFLKEQCSLAVGNRWSYVFAPVFSLVLALSFWVFYPVYGFSFLFFPLGVLFFLCVSSLGVYGTLVAGWASNSKYALLGAFRAIAQTISYEVSMVLVLLSGVVLVGSYNFLSFLCFQGSSFWLCFVVLPVFLVWVVTTVAETNRAPFDFAEGESELVSGFNIEYGGGGFALIFMAEYGSILVMSLASACLFLGGSEGSGVFSGIFLIAKCCTVAFVILWIRGSFPRLRYDKLMYLAWKSFLPFSLGYLSFVFLVVGLCLS